MFDIILEMVFKMLLLKCIPIGQPMRNIYLKTLLSHGSFQILFEFFLLKCSCHCEIELRTFFCPNYMQSIISSIFIESFFVIFRDFVNYQFQMIIPPFSDHIAMINFKLIGLIYSTSVQEVESKRFAHRTIYI